MGTEGMTAPAPFSDPTVRNDYYTYDYKVPQNLPTTLKVDVKNPAGSVTRAGKGLRFRSAQGHDLLPLYDANRMRYCVYWNLEK